MAMGISIIIVFLVVLFALAFISKRRFGVLGLALAAGWVLSQVWAVDLTVWLNDLGVHLTSPPLEAVVSIALNLLPALLLLFGGPKYVRIAPRVVGSLLFAALAFAFTRQALNDSLVLGTTVEDAFDTIGLYDNYAIGAGIVLAVLDMLFVRNHHNGKKHADHKKA